jgi:hypothetical protein
MAAAPAEARGEGLAELEHGFHIDALHVSPPRLQQATPGAALPLIKKTVRDLARDSDFWFGNHWVVDSTRSRAAWRARLWSPSTPAS